MNITGLVSIQSSLTRDRNFVSGGPPEHNAVYMPGFASARPGRNELKENLK